jgi:hypothetical protein
MTDREEAVSVLLGGAGVMWRAETRHESVLLLSALYRSNVEARSRIVSAILAGPAEEWLEGEHAGERRDYAVFELLAFLEAEQLPLPAEATQKLRELRAIYPAWRLSKYPGMSHWVESGWVGKSVSVDDVKSLKPEDVAARVVACEGTDTQERDMCEAVGTALGRNLSWGLEVLAQLRGRIEDIREESLNPVLWGLRAAVSEGTSDLDNEKAVTLLNAIATLVDARPVPVMWSSLPSALKQIVGKWALPASCWNDLAVRLAAMFEDFDYERRDRESPIEWIQRAINHPFGDLAELYLDLSQELARQQTQSNSAVTFEPYSERFFDRMLSHYGAGSRYGYCLLTQRLSWVEAVSVKLGENLRTLFDWREGDERPLVAWSGYLWSRALSKRLVEDFGRTYLEAAKRHARFADSERRGLTSHIAAVFWFRAGSLNQLYQYAETVDSGLRIGLLHEWRVQLKNVDASRAKEFFDEIVLPYWEWCGRQTFFSASQGDRERFGFWELLPYSYAAFPEACRKAVQFRPTSISFPHLFVRELSSAAVLEHPNELIELLIVLGELDPNVHWEEKEWRQLWEALKMVDAKRFTELTNVLARKGILPNV